MPQPGATVVVLDDGGLVLLHRRRDFRIWALPGGGIEPGETGEQAAIREVREETGYEVAVECFIGEYRRPETGLGVGRAYRARITGGRPIQHGPETREVRWFPVGALPWNLPSLHRLYIRDALAGAATPVQRTVRIPLFEMLLFRFLRWLRYGRKR